VPQGAVGWFGGYYDLKRYARCTRLVAITPHMRNDLLGRGADADRVSLIPTFAALEDSPPASRRDLGTPPDAPLLLCLARLHRKKGLDTLLEAMALLPEAHLWLAGEGELRNTLEAQGARLGLLPRRLRFLGWRQDRGALLRAADLLVVPSRYEPFGTVVIEGWAAGTPVVAAAAAGPAATITDGETGLLVPVDDAPALAAAIRRVLGDGALRQRLVSGASAALEARYSRAAVVSAWFDLLARHARGRTRESAG
jgi:glycosyltransferase involved in cell wall biosynthesis